MKELFSLIGKRDFKGLFYRKTDNIFIQFFRYCFVGGIATVVEGGALWLIQHFAFREQGGFYVFIAQTIAFVLGLTAGYPLGAAAAAEACRAASEASPMALSSAS